MDDDYRLDTRLDLKSTERDGQWGHFTGIATTSDEDLAGDVIEAGAFEPINVPNVALLAFHDPAAPVGKWERLQQQGRRLVAKGALLLSLPRGREVYDMLKGGVLNGLSVGFRVTPGGAVVDERGRRTINKGQLLEISLVSVPANGRCRVTETLAYHCDTLEQKLASLDSRWQADIAGTRSRLFALQERAFDAIAGAAADGQIAEAKAITLLTELRDALRA